VGVVRSPCVLGEGGGAGGGGGGEVVVVSWLEHSSPDRVVWIGPLAGGFVMCS